MWEDGSLPTQEYDHSPTSLWLPVCLAQFSLLSEVRGVISPQDLDRFDNLVLKREIESMKARQPSGPSISTDSYSMMSYSDTVSSSSSHFTATTVSSARVSPSLPFSFNTCSWQPYNKRASLHCSGDISLTGSPVHSASPMGSPKAFFIPCGLGAIM